MQLPFAFSTGTYVQSAMCIIQYACFDMCLLYPYTVHLTYQIIHVHVILAKRNIVLPTFETMTNEILCQWQVLSTVYSFENMPCRILRNPQAFVLN